MAKSRSRSPRWKSRQPPYRSPEHNRHRHFQEHYQDGEGFHRNPRRPIHWEEERHGQNNSRMTPYKRYNDKSYEQDSFSTDLRKLPFDSSSRFKRLHSPDRRGEGNWRFPTKYPEDHNRHSHREHRDYHHRSQEPNTHIETNGFKPARREETFHRSYHREPDRDWNDHDGHWNQDHSDSYLPPPGRRSEEFVDRNSFHKRHTENHDYREHEPHPKRTREPDRHDYRQPPRHSHWNDDHSSQPYHDKDWSKETDLRDPSPVVLKTHSGELAKIQYDYSHRSPSYVHAESQFSSDRTERHNRYEDQKNYPSRTSQHYRSNRSSRERGKFSERQPEPSTKYSERKAPDRDTFQTDNKYANLKHKESGKKAEYKREPNSKRHMDNHSPKSSDPTTTPKINSEKESVMANLDLKKPMDKYRQPHEHWNISKDIKPKSEVPQGKRNYEEKRSNTTSNERQLSVDLVAVDGKDVFHPVFDHLSSSKHGETTAPSTVFTQEIITIIHEVKANHFKSPGMSLHERFSKLQAESNKEEITVNKPTAQLNPEIHRRIDISLEDLQNKTLHKSEVTLAGQRIIEDPHDLRHDIERRRKQRLHSEEDINANVGFCDSNAPGSYYKPHNNETGEFQKMARGGRAPFRKSAGRPPGSSYGRNSDQFFSSRSHFERSDEVRKPYKPQKDCRNCVKEMLRGCIAGLQNLH